MRSRFFRLFCLCLTLPLTLTPYSSHGQTANIQDIDLNRPIEGVFASGDKAHKFQITAAPNQLAVIEIEQTGVDVAARVFGANDKLVAVFDLEPRLRERERIEFVAAPAGVYRIEIFPVARSGAGSYSIRLNEIRSATDRDKQLNEARILTSRARTLDRLAKYDEAYPLAARALEIGERLLGPEDAYVAYLLKDLGYLQWRKGEYATAEATLQRALAINAKTLGPEHPQAVAAMNIFGNILRNRGDSVKAEQLFQRSVEITERTLGSEHPEMVGYLIDLGIFYSSKGDSVLTERFLTRALAVAEKVFEPDDRNIGIILNNLGVHYLDVKDHARAKVFLERSLAINERNGDTEIPVYSYTLQNLGIIAREKKDYSRALELYGRSLNFRERIFGADHPNNLPLLNNMANIHRAIGDYPKALEIQQRVLSIAEKSLGRYHGMTFQSLGNIAKIFAAQGDVPNAVRTQVRADETLEKILALDLAAGSERQKRAYFDTLAERTDRTISLHLGMARTDKTARDLAVTVLLQRKGRVLDAMSDSVASLRRRFAPHDQKLLDQLNETTAQLAKLALSKPNKMPPDEYAAELKRLEESKEKAEAEISRKSAEFRVYSQPITLAAVRAEIPADAALVEFAVYRPFDPKAQSNSEAYGKPRYVAYIVRQTGDVSWAELGDAAAIDTAVDELRKALRDSARKDVDDLARAVDEKVMRPVRASLGDAARLLISPDGELSLIPFEALMDEHGRYLVHRFSFSYLTSGRDVLRMRTARESKSSPLIIANPLFGEPAVGRVAGSTGGGDKRPGLSAKSSLYFAPLAGTDTEARVIRTLFPDAAFFSGAEAAESAVKQSRAPSMMHVATHGFFLDDGKSAVDTSSRTTGGNTVAKIGNPLLRSGLALAGANRRTSQGDDGILTALEASGLDLWGTKLVVLSACDTGIGEVRNGEGVYGLRRAFVLAGSESLVMSLWPVSDYVTRELMSGYYKNLKQGLGRGESLRRVQLEMLKQPNRQHPFYWASFIQSGEWASLDGKR